jgi:hypothetical protein
MFTEFKEIRIVTEIIRQVANFPGILKWLADKRSYGC